MARALYRPFRTNRNWEWKHSIGQEKWHLIHEGNKPRRGGDVKWYGPKSISVVISVTSENRTWRTMDEGQGKRKVDLRRVCGAISATGSPAVAIPPWQTGAWCTWTLQWGTEGAGTSTGASNAASTLLRHALPRHRLPQSTCQRVCVFLGRVQAAALP